jgi:hypothetical protein
MDRKRLIDLKEGDKVYRLTRTELSRVKVLSIFNVAETDGNARAITFPDNEFTMLDKDDNSSSVLIGNTQDKGPVWISTDDNIINDALQYYTDKVAEYTLLKRQMIRMKQRFEQFNQIKKKNENVKS